MGRPAAATRNRPSRPPGSRLARSLRRGGRRQPDPQPLALDGGFQLIANALPDLVWSACPEGAVDFYSQRLLAYLGKTPAQLAGQAWAEALHPDDRVRVVDLWADALRSGNSYQAECRLRRGSDGRYRWHLARALPLKDASGRIVRWFGACADIEERKRAELALVQSQAMLARAERIAQFGSWEWDPRTNDFLWSEQMYRILGLEPGPRTMSRDWYLQQVAPADRARVSQAPRDALRTGQPYDMEYRILVAGCERWVHARGEVSCDKHGRPVRLTGVLQDITDRKNAEEALRIQEERFRTLVTNLPGAVFRCDVNPPWRSQYCSDGISAITGYPESCFRDGTRTYAGMIVPDDLPSIERSVSDSIAANEAFSVEHRILHADGRIRWVIARGRAICERSGTPLWIDGVMFDITARKQAEADARDIEIHLAQLSEAERKVLDLLVSGTPRKQIAYQLQFGLRTVQLHRSHIMEKMRVESLAELVQMMHVVKSAANPQHLPEPAPNACAVTSPD